jgi:hypothetical protein
MGIRIAGAVRGGFNLGLINLSPCDKFSYSQKPNEEH